jgi:undecaprenyl diphosphate synthase
MNVIDIFFIICYVFFIIFTLLIIVNRIYKIIIKNKNKIQRTTIDDNVSIIIPFYNEEKLLLKTLTDMTALNLKGEMILIDDGSTDNGCKIINDFIIDYNNSNFFIKIIHTEHKGKGHALRIGFDNALYKTIIMNDADNEYDNNQIPDLIKQFNNSNCIMLIGQRNKKTDKIIEFGYKIILFLIQGTYIKDPFSGLRIFRKSLLEKISLTENGFGIENELNIKTSYIGNIEELPINYKRRTKEEGKKLIGITKYKTIISIIFNLLKSPLYMFQINKKLPKKILNDSDINHVAIILDGNRRYCKRVDANKKNQHLIGMIKMQEMIYFFRDTNIQYLTLYAFAEANWKRSKDEIKGIMFLLYSIRKEYEKKEQGLLRNIKLKILSTSTDNFTNKVKNDINIINKIGNNIKNPSLICNIMLSYSGRKEIINAINACKDNEKNKITEEIMEKYLLTRDCPPLNIMIRPGGDIRLSDFLLYQCAYTELFFINKKFPEITKNDITNILDEYHNRKRNYGS